MKVVIDGVQFVPALKPLTGKSLAAALDYRFDSDAGDDLTVRDYLHKLIWTLWNEGSAFSGKRPFGNSDWEHVLLSALARGGFIEATMDDEGWVETFKDEHVANRLVFDLLQLVFYPTSAT